MIIRIEDVESSSLSNEDLILRLVNVNEFISLIDIKKCLVNRVSDDNVEEIIKALLDRKAIHLHLHIEPDLYFYMSHNYNRCYNVLNSSTKGKQFEKIRRLKYIRDTLNKILSVQLVSPTIGTIKVKE